MNKQDLADELENKLSSKEKEYEQRRELSEGDKVFLDNYLIKSNIENKLEDIVEWARNKGFHAKDKVLRNLISEKVMRDETFPDQDVYQFVFSVKEKRFFRTYCHVKVRALVTSERDNNWKRIIGSDRKVTWAYEGGEEAKYSGVHSGSDGMSEEQMIVLFKGVMIDLVDNL